jgi:hypothetical protein
MTTEAKVAANRRNAARSTAPCTQQGKAIVAQNALKHGLLARQDVIAGEDPQEFELCRDRLLGELAPVGDMETLLAQRIVSLAWRLKRAQRFQDQLFDYLLAKELEDWLDAFDDTLSEEEVQEMTRDPETDPGLAIGRVVAGDYCNGKVLDRLMLYERRIESSLYRTMKELQSLRLARRQGIASNSEPTTDSVKQSQSPAGEAHPACETKPTEAAGSDCAKQSQPAADGGHGEAAGPDKPACETKPIAPAGADCDKQSQRPKPAAGFMTVPRRARVACHYHNTTRPY